VSPGESWARNRFREAVPPPNPDETSSLLAQGVGEETAGERAPGKLGVLPQRLCALERGEAGAQHRPPVGRVEVGREREHGRIVKLGLAVDVAAGGEDEEGAANGGVAFGIVERNRLPGRVRKDDELDVASRSGTRLRSSRS